MTILLDNGFDNIKVVIGKKLKDFTTDRYQYKELENQDLAFDHALVIAYAILRLNNKIEYTDIVFNMMPEYFTLGEYNRFMRLYCGRNY